MMGSSARSNRQARTSGGPSAHSYSTHKNPRSATFTSSPSYSSPRVNQPSGFVPLMAYDIVRYLAGSQHEYAYYPNDWTNADGQTFRKGYYDEQGNHYENVAVENSETIVECEYCGSQTKIVWKAGESPKCPNCNAPLKVDIVDKPAEDPAGTQTQASMQGDIFPDENAGTQKNRMLRIIIAAIVIVIFLQVVATILGYFFSFQNSGYYNNFNQSSYVPEDSIYVEELGRTCYLDGEDYYDEETKCWFYYDDYNGNWKYWFDGISSDYGDYGWMEYDYDDGNWYVQTGEDDWEVLPYFYNQSQLWHFSE